MDIKKLHDLFLKCDSICTDTRSNCKGSLFFALKGCNFNGNDFALESLSKGANYAIVDDKTIDHPKCLLVDDVLKLDNGSEVQISKCPNNHGKIKSPLCCGEDMSCNL